MAARRLSALLITTTLRLPTLLATTALRLPALLATTVLRLPAVLTIALRLPNLRTTSTTATTTAPPTATATRLPTLLTTIATRLSAPLATTPLRLPAPLATTSLATTPLRLSALLATTALLLGTLAPVSAETAPRARFDQPRPGFAPVGTVLRPGSPERAGLDPVPLDRALAAVRDHTTGAAPLFPGAVTLLAHDGVIAKHEAVGWAVRSSGATTELPEADRVPMSPDTIFDLASISKLFTAIAVVRQAELGRVRIDRPVAEHLPEFGVAGKGAITVRQLLTHTSGLAAWLPLWSGWPDRDSRIKAVMDVAPTSPPGTAYRYSDLNLIALGVLVERVSGLPLDAVVRETITEPLGLVDTGYNPPPEKLGRIAATEFQSSPPRGIVRGSVHDENAWSLGGVAGHAGVFSTARELAVLAQAVLNGGTYGGRRILSEESVTGMLTNLTPEFPGNAHGLGFELDTRWYMGALSAPRTAGHTGFTGTTMVLDPASRSIALLLTNRVHPSRDRGSINPARRTVASGLAEALAVGPVRGRSAWRGDPGGVLATKTLPEGPKALRFSAFTDLDAGESVTVQEFDGVAWRDLRVFTGASSRSWERVELPMTGTAARWVRSGAGANGARGGYVDAIEVVAGHRVLLDGERGTGEVTASGWRAVDR
ncbi:MULTISPECIES: serine hydrolase [Actinosynnema]|uniref:serine hydrolase domain-containing protein n=1 Tax=Actinosynnema TaxID=40566 RepID=UPI0020A33249|nr:serine hydrolase domain-containing protein [Actinosynnema pretiosum]